MSASAALAVAVALAGCGTTTYFAGRVLAAQRVDQPCPDRDPEPQRLYQGRTADRGRLLRHPQRLQRTSRQRFPFPGFGGALPISIQNMPEEQLGAVYGSGDGSLTMVNYATGKDHRHRRRLEWSFVQHLHDPQRGLCFRGQPGGPRPDGGQPGQNGASYPLEPSRRLPREREPRRHRWRWPLCRTPITSTIRAN